MIKANTIEQEVSQFMRSKVLIILLTLLVTASAFMWMSNQEVKNDHVRIRADRDKMLMHYVDMVKYTARMDSAVKAIKEEKRILKIEKEQLLDSIAMFGNILKLIEEEQEAMNTVHLKSRRQ